ncbi:MAG: hypothetical protein AAFR58_04380 [Cyanobacteria bacterium J06627_28]
MSVVPSQILYLEHDDARLYADAIQVISTRQLCWVRPTLLIQGLPESDQTLRQAVISNAAQCPEQSGLTLYDLEGSPDLIWPLTPFEIAYDIDFFSLLVQLKISSNSAALPAGKQQLHQFTHSFWRKHPDFFQFNPPKPLSSQRQ